MDDLQLVRELGDETPLPAAAALAPARARLVAEIKPRKNNRIGIIAASTIGLAAAVAAVVTVLPDSVPTHQDAALTNSAAPVDTAVQLLNHAAAAALTKPDVVPRPDQLYYVRNGEREVWSSVDGTHDGLILEHPKGERVPVPGCRDGRVVVYDKQGKVTGATEECKPQGVYRSDLPTTAEGMQAYLKGTASYTHEGVEYTINIYGKSAVNLVMESYLPPQQRAAYFEALAKSPGLQIVRDVKDASGRPGIGVTWPAPPGSVERAKPPVMVFAKDSFTYLGTTERAIDSSGFVDQVGQKP